MSKGPDRQDEDTARNLPLRKEKPNERYSMPKEIPEDLFDDLELPSAPKAAAPPKPLSIPALGNRAPRRPGEFRDSSTPVKVAEQRTPTLSGADLFMRSTELPALSRFAGYDVLGRLAIGGMAEILLARAPGEARPIVLKKILATFDRDDEFVEMFLDEARVGMQLDHPNIARFTGAGEEGRQYYIAMEWVNGVTLGKLVRRARAHGGLSPAIVCELVRAIADALHYAHTSRNASGELMGLIHRDVSPHNIMIGYDGSVKLLDFGIAKAMGAAHTTGPGVVKGKFAYMSPEQCEGQNVDFRSDIFSLGVVLFEALTGEPLYRRGNDRETVVAITRGPVPSLRDKWKRRDAPAPRELIAICSTALAKHPSERFPTAAAMRDVLTLFIDGQGEDIGAGRIANLVQTIFADELASGPSVAAPLAPALSTLRPPGAGRPSPIPTLAPPGRRSAERPTPVHGASPPRARSSRPAPGRTSSRPTPAPASRTSSRPTPAPVSRTSSRPTPARSSSPAPASRSPLPPPPAEDEHAWSSDTTAVQDAADREAVLRELRSATPRVDSALIPSFTPASGSSSSTAPVSSSSTAPARSSSAPPARPSSPAPRPSSPPRRPSTPPRTLSTPPPPSSRGWWVVALVVALAFGALAVFIATR